MLLGVNHLSLSTGSPVATNNGIDPASISHVLYNLQYPPSGPTGSGLFFTAGDIAAAESGSLFGDGAIVTHPLHGIMPDFSNVAPGGNQFLRSIAAAPQIDDLQTAGQSYFIEPPQPTTTTIKPTFKRRKTRRPISSLAEKSRKDKAAAENSDNTLNNEVFQGNPVPFNPFRQIVNTSFGGRKRPTDNKQGRTRSRPNTAKQATGSALDGDNEPKNINTLNEIPKAEGEPRVLGRRKPDQEVRSLRPTSTIAAITGGDDINVEQPPRGGRRVAFRKPRPSVDAGADADSAPGPENVNPKPLRPRLVKRLKPRPTTTISAPATETESDAPTEITDPITVSHPIFSRTSPQPQPQPTEPEEFKPRVRPARPLVVNRFANANRNTATTTPSTSDSVDVPASSLSPSSFPKRRPLRPTTRQQSLRTSTEAPEDVLGNFVNEATPAPVSGFGGGRGRGDGSRKSPREGREGRQGFLLRPRPTPTNVAVDTSVNPTGQGQSAENEVGLRRPLSNRRRKRPTTTVASQLTGKEFTGGIVEENVIPVAPPSERYNPGRRINPVLRSRPTPLPPLPATEGPPPAYQVREQQPIPQPVQEHVQTFGDITQRFVSNSQGASNIGQNFFRRPTGPSAPASVAPVQLQSPIQPGFNNIMNNHPSLIDPNNFVPNFQFPQQQNLGFYQNGFDNSLGSPSNFRNIQLPGANEFSSRSTSTDEEPEISNSDFSPAASTEKQSVSSSNNAETAATPSLENITGAEQENKTETEKTEVKIPTAKLSPIERLQQNRQAAARRLLAPRKPTEKTTAAPSAATQNIGKNFRKSVIPPRMLRPRGKLPGFNAAKTQLEEKPVPNDGRENDSGAVDEKSTNNEIAATPEIANDASSSETEKQDTNAIPNSPNPKLETTTTRKPTILEAAKRRRIPSALAKSADQQQQKQQEQQKIKATSTPPPTSHDTEATPPTCEEGQRYSKFLKRCVTMYKPRVQG